MRASPAVSFGNTSSASTTRLLRASSIAIAIFLSKSIFSNEVKHLFEIHTYISESWVCLRELCSLVYFLITFLLSFFANLLSFWFASERSEEFVKIDNRLLSSALTPNQP